jgi:hypothetical protein
VDAGRVKLWRRLYQCREMVFMADVQLPWKLVMANDLRKEAAFA